MNSLHVIFENLNLDFHFSKIAFTIFGISIYKYAICIVLGIIVSLIIIRFLKDKYEISFDDAVIGICIALFFGIIGARFYYILFNKEISFNEFFNFRDGGLAIYGGLIFGIISILIYSKIMKINMLDFCDLIVPFVALSQSFGRWGNFFNGEAYGKGTNSLFKMTIENVAENVHPTFLYESFACLLIFIVLMLIRKKRKYKGEITLKYLLMYSFIRIFIEGIRVDSLYLGSFRISQILSILIFIVSFIIYFYNLRKLKDNKN